MSDGWHVSEDLIAGELRLPGGRLRGAVCDSNTGQRLAAIVETEAGMVERALEFAHNRGRDWSETAAELRARAMLRIAAVLESRVEAMAVADARTTGVLLELTRMFAALACSAFRGAAGVLRERSAPLVLDGPLGEVQVRRLPVGPAAVIAPWNAPVVIAAHKVASALAAGCPVILKPSELAPTSCEILAQAIAEAELPPAAFQLVHGDAGVGSALASDARVKVVSFTGGLEGGRSVAAACAHAMKPAQLELGGNNPLVVLEGADTSQAAGGVIAGLTTMTGQWCRAIGRIIVHRSVTEPLLDAVERRLGRLRIGASTDSHSEMGPLAHGRQFARVRDAVTALERAGGRLLRPSRLPETDGYFVAPTLVQVDPRHANREIFGPVATVHEFDDPAEAVALANDSAFGLAAYVFGPQARAQTMGEQIRAGVVKLNGVSLLGLNPRAPRPAWGLSGIGDEGLVETFEHFRGSQVLGAAGVHTGGIA